MQCLGVSVNSDELDTLDPGFNHSVNSIATAAADTDDFYMGILLDINIK